MSIQDFINNLFSSKPDEKRKKWTQIFLDQEYQTVEDLANFSQDDWKFFEKTLPHKIVSDIKNEIKKLFGNEKIIKNEEVMKNDVLKEIAEIKKNQQNSEPLEKMEQKHYQKYQLNPKEIETILELLSTDIDPLKIVSIMNAKSGSPKQQAIFQIISAHLKPPRSFPKNAKKMTQKRKQSESLPIFHYEGLQQFTRKYYTLLIIGETGAGKSTLLDFIVNYLNGIEYKDNWRWKLVDESHLNQQSAGKSKTSKITVYYINDYQNKFNLRVIDTPGFGDTSGIKVDNEITDQFETLFNQIDEINYILLVIKASQNRLKHSSKYIYDRVQQLFGKDAKDHFILMCTFADDKEPSCLQMIQKEIYFSKYFTFNNSALYTPPQKGNAITKLSWKMGMESMKKFTEYVIQSDRIPLSLKMSKQILESRKYLQKSIRTSQKCFKQAIRQLDIAQTNFKNLQKNRQKIKENGSYQEQYQKIIYDEEELPKYVQLCTNCKITCCLKCQWPQNKMASSCSYFWLGRSCPVCPQHCPRQSHIRTNKKISQRMIIQTRTIDFKKKSYEEGIKGQEIYIKQFDKKAQNINELVMKISKINEQIKELLRKLQETALKPKIFTDEQYYQQIIKTEKENQEEGWTERVENLQEMIEQLNTIKKIQENKSVYDLLPVLKEFDSSLQQVEIAKKNKANNACSIY